MFLTRFGLYNLKCVKPFEAQVLTQYREVRLYNPNQFIIWYDVLQTMIG